ncbi:MAG TPA: agmatine deiminase family protein, partial [Terriglobales bacterium]|nr:agmatine deiminase family protein [Terriglobales bacterium]
MQDPDLNISVPPEWAPQKTIWTAWPADLEQWDGDLEAPRRDVAALVWALAASNKVKVLVKGGEVEDSAREALGGDAELVRARYGDIWLRDTGPIFACASQGAVSLCFKSNGWGGRFD